MTPPPHAAPRALDARPFRVRLSELAPLARALQDALAGRFIDRVWAPHGDALLLRLAQGRGDRRRLLLEASPTCPRAVYSARWPETPAAPTRAALTLRRALEGARVTAVTPWHDRGLDLSLTRGDGPRLLRVQLAGRFPNVAVLSLAPHEENEGGSPMEGPASPQPLATLLANRPPFDPPSPPCPQGPPRVEPTAPDAWLEAWDALTWRETDRLTLARRARAVARALTATQRRLARRSRALDRDAERARAGETYRQRGELLKGLLGQIPRGASGITARDWSREDAPEVWVPLDPARAPVDNMRRYFERYRKAARAAAPIARRRAELEADLQRLNAARAALDALPWDEPREAGEALAALERAWSVTVVPTSGPAHRPTRASARPRRREPFYRFLGAGGAEILVGRSARDNDDLTFHHARGRDIWLHLRDGPGSHVILRHDARDEPPPEPALRDAALLAAWYSSARGEPLVDVLWTRRKHVRRPPGAPPGQVTVAGAATRAVRADPERLRVLHGPGRGPGRGGAAAG